MPDRSATFPLYERRDVDAAAFVDFWARLYRDPRQCLYDDNIGKPLNRAAILALFEWKNGGTMSARKRESVVRNYVETISEAIDPFDISDAETFLTGLSGGAIWAIFWLHCLRPLEYPIFDQHVWRSMHCVLGKDCRELTGFSKNACIQKYLGVYLPWFRRSGFPDIQHADRALWTHGKFVKRWNL